MRRCYIVSALLPYDNLRVAPKQLTYKSTGIYEFPSAVLNEAKPSMSIGI